MTKHTIIYSEGFKNVQRIPKTKEEAYMTEKKTEKKERKPGKRQNDYPADVRMAWVDYVDMLARSGEISAKLSNRVTL